MYRSGWLNFNQSQGVTVNVKVCKALRRVVGPLWRQTDYNVPPLVPVYGVKLGTDGKPSFLPNGKPELQVLYYKTDTVTLSKCGRSVYQAMKETIRQYRANNYQFHRGAIAQ
jgi:hypothetical protein